MLLRWTTSIAGVIGAETVIGACLFLPREGKDADSAADTCGLRLKVTLYPRLTTYAAIMTLELMPFNRHLKMVLT
jgi:hypothetical protein